MSDTSVAARSSGKLILRVAMLGVLAGAVVLLTLDRTAGGKCDAAFRRINEELLPMAGGNSKEVSAARVQELVGFAPQQVDAAKLAEHFYFVSPTRKFRLTVAYARGRDGKTAQECDQGIGAAAQ